MDASTLFWIHDLKTCICVALGGVSREILGHDPSVSKSNRSYTDNLQCFFTNLGYILLIPLKQSLIFLKS